MPVIRLISMRWSESIAGQLEDVGHCPPSDELNSSATICSAPSWWRIMDSRKSVELGCGCRLELGELLLREHPGHQRLLAGCCAVAVGVGVRDLLATVAKPALHLRDLVPLGHLDAQRQLGKVGPDAARCHEAGHLKGLGVVRNHGLHKLNVRLAIGRRFEGGNLVVGQLTVGLSRFTELDDRSLARARLRLVVTHRCN